MPSVVVKNEAKFFTVPGVGIPKPIHLSLLVQQNKIQEATATNIELDVVTSRFDRSFIKGLHDGEIEAMALLLAGYLPDHGFCTSDGIAIQATVMLGLRDALISFEKVLQKLGTQKQLSSHYKEDFLKKHMKIGGENLVRNYGLVKS